MDRIQLLAQLAKYNTPFLEEADFIPRFISLISNFPNCFDRSLITGHITASAWIVDSFSESALLIHHKKLDRWLQPGGHTDGNEDTLSTACREAHEETGISTLVVYSSSIFDLDIHLIPAREKIQAHLHYDIRYLCVADRHESLLNSHEINELAWLPLDSIGDYTDNSISINRMVQKTRIIFNKSNQFMQPIHGL